MEVDKAVEIFQKLVYEDPLQDDGSLDSRYELHGRNLSEEYHLGARCEQLLSEIRKQQDASENSTQSIRELFPNTKVSDMLSAVLNPLLNDRIDTQKLLPGTQDDAANEEVLSESTKAAFSLTLPSMQAGLLYAHLLNHPGALGSGLVDLEPLTALVALVRRWTVECCGREKLVNLLSSESSSAPCVLADSPSKSPPLKRSRKVNRTSRTKTLYDDNDIGSSKNHTSVILAMGSLVALEVCKIPQQSEFRSWSSESREVLIEAILVATGTAAALLSGTRGKNDGRFHDFPGDSNTKDTPERKILAESGRAFENCLIEEEENGDEELENGDSQKHQQSHETAIIILRGLMHFLQLKIGLPNGEKGKIAAHAAASDMLVTLMQKSNLALLTAKENLEPYESSKTPSRRKSRRSSMDGVLTNASRKAHRTPKSTITNRRRTSLDGNLTPIKSPALKKKHNNDNISSYSERVSDTTNITDKPRGVPAIYLGLLQKLTTGRVGLEKAALRKSTVETVQSCMRWLPYSERAHFLDYILRICHSKVSVHRLVACELLGSILSQDWMAEHQHDCLQEGDYEDRSFYGTPSENSPNGSNGSMVLPHALWKALQGRLLDRIAAVRASAANSLENVLTEIQKRTSPTWHKLHFLSKSDGERLLMALRKRAIKDETATVRKAAILALTKLLLAQPENISATYVSAVCELCQDSSLLTRRAAAEALTNLLEATPCIVAQSTAESFPNDEYEIGLIEEAWSACVLPMVLDEETSLKARSAFHKVVVSPILNEDSIVDGEMEKIAWRILASVGNLTGQEGASKGGVQALKTALSQLGREEPEMIHSALFRKVLDTASRTISEHEASEDKVVGAWCILEALLTIDTTRKTKVGRSSKKDDVSFCVSAWKFMLERHRSSPKLLSRKSTLRSSLIVLSKLSGKIPTTDAENSANDVLQALLHFQFPPDVVGPAINAMMELTKQSETSGGLNCKAWIGKLFSESEQQLVQFVQDTSSDAATTEQHQPQLLRALFSVGEVSMIGFKLDDDEKSNPTPAYLKPSKRMKELIQIIVSGHLPGVSQIKIPSAIRAHAFTVLGKFCLRDEDLARRSLTLLARELHSSLPNPNRSVQSNALLVMGDLCVRYTNMTDRYLPTMAACLQNGCSSDSLSILERSSIVRKHAVLLLSSLLLQDFIKWRGLLFHRFLVACSDEDEEVAALAESVLSGPLMVRNPKIFFNHFVESIFVLNKCTAHPIYVSAARQGDGGSGIAVSFDGINLNGEEGQARRRIMYDFLLSKLTDEEKIGVTARLAKEVLGEAAGNEGDLSEICRLQSPPDDSSSQRVNSAWNVLADTFYVLTNRSIKVGKVQDDIEGGIEDPNQVPNPSRQVTVAKTRLLSKISLKHMVEIVLPILCNLKVTLQGSRSPLLKELMTYLLEIFRNHKVEVKEFLANDPTLLQEIEYDARKHSTCNEA